MACRGSLGGAPTTLEALGGRPSHVVGGAALLPLSSAGIVWLIGLLILCNWCEELAKEPRLFEVFCLRQPASSPSRLLLSSPPALHLATHPARLTSTPHTSLVRKQPGDTLDDRRRWPPSEPWGRTRGRKVTILVKLSRSPRPISTFTHNEEKVEIQDIQ